jgi:hypothetical protein
MSHTVSFIDHISSKIIIFSISKFLERSIARECPRKISVRKLLDLFSVNELTELYEL